MADSAARSFFKGRTFPFFLTVFILFLSATILVFFSSNAFQSPSWYRRPQSVPNVLSASPPPPQAIDFTKSELDPAPALLAPPPPPTPKGGDVSENDDGPADVDFNWGLCRGPVAVDYIPCLDNFLAIKALKSRRHMEHRERHCPDPSPRCLVPLPLGYKAPVPWPKSRDMVRLILR